MYPWDILGIDQTDDKKIIKKAYAKLIRQYRPDEAPERFQEINQAYQYALKFISKEPKAANIDQLIKQTTTKPQKSEETRISSSDQVNVETNEVDTHEDQTLIVERESNSEIDDAIDTQHEMEELEHVESGEEQIINESVVEMQVNEPDEKSQSTDSLDQVNTTDINTEQKIIDELFDRTHQMVFETIHEKLKKNNWEFLSEFHNILDFEVKDQVSKRMFRQVAKYNFFQLKENKILLLPPEVMIYFDEVFNWSAYWQEYEKSIEPVYCEHMLNLVQPDPLNKTHKSSVGWFVRIFAFGIDALVSLFFTMLVAGSFSIQNYGEIIWFSSFFLHQMVGQTSKLCQSIGQKTHDIQVYDHFLNRPSVNKILIRNAVFCVTLLSYHYIIFLSFGSVLQFFMAMTVITVNVLSLSVKKQWLHEWVSQTVLVK